MSEERKPWYARAQSRAEEKGLSLQEIGNRLGGLHKTTIGKWFAGEREPSLGSIKKLAEILDMSFDELIAHDMDFVVTDQDEREWLNAYRRMTPEQRAAELAVKRLAAKDD